MTLLYFYSFCSAIINSTPSSNTDDKTKDNIIDCSIPNEKSAFKRLTLNPASSEEETLSSTPPSDTQRGDAPTFDLISISPLPVTNEPIIPPPLPPKSATRPLDNLFDCQLLIKKRAVSMCIRVSM